MNKSVKLRSSSRSLMAVSGLLLSSAVLNAQIIVDGTRDAGYGSPIVVQSVQTQFGDANPYGGSELDAAYASIANNRLYLFFSGNLEPNFNKLEVFIDSVVGGENILMATPEYDFNNTSLNLGGMQFDTGFTADYHLFSRWGNGGVDPFEVDFVNRQGGFATQVPGAAGSGSVPVSLVSSGSLAAGTAGGNYSGTSLSQALEFAINNNNTAGVMGGTGAADQVAAAAVATGMEFSISLDDLGSPGYGSVIRIAAMIGNGDHNYLSNQSLDGLPADTGNLGGDGAGGFTGTLSGVNFNNFTGNQYFVVVVPEPSTFALAGLGIAALTISRRRR